MLTFEHINQTVGITVAYEMMRQRLETVAGFLSPIEGYLLMMLAAHGPGEGAVVEIGSYKGRSTCFLAIGSQFANRGPVTAVDPMPDLPVHESMVQGEMLTGDTLESPLAEFNANIARQGLTDLVTLRRMTSLEAARDWTGPIRLLFIDGDHSYESVATDFFAWERFVVPGGMICFHDVGGWEGVTRFVDQLKANPRYVEQSRVVSLAAFSKLG